MGPGALETALALYQAPSLAAATRLRPVPGDVFEVIRIAAGDGEAIDAAVARSGVEATVVCEAAQLYLKHVLFDPDADHYRVLGVAPDADSAQIREHRRWLLKWLHPDRADEWDAVYAARVQQAWQQLRDPARRAGYDEDIADADDWVPAMAGQALRPVWTAKALPAEDRASPSRRGAAWITSALVSVVALGAAWSMWGPGGPGGTVPGYPTGTSPAAAQGPYVLERVPWVEPGAGATAEAEVETVATRVEHPPREHPTPSAQPRPPAREAATTTPPANHASPVFSRPTPAASRPADPRPAEPAEPMASVAMDPVAPASAVPAPRSPTTGRIDPDAIEAAMSGFRNAYERGDIEALMAVFTADARNRRGGREAIRQDYVGLFRSSRQRRLQWHSMQWQADADHARGEGGFVASITPRRGATNTVRGRVRVEVVQQGGQARIRELWHEDQVP
ncbi:DnaJ domain-containing protein [Alkalisalibacterium limincola]|uniref:DnaJ domain-containing protein n=1 Tax=Alkalisalibacterium limincola TaxID=2699169 RepID=A0A5C8KX32_9GAMM|nr:DnaJ domain-containing protein [Alkalisalibacterium limincola]TXK65608.1 DnaJ domain-containing protein [Alkalisalibacterium limincola]